MRKVDGSSGPEDYDGVADKVAKRAGKQMGWSRAAWDEDWHKVDKQLRAGPRAMDMAVIRSELATMAFWKSRGRCKHSCLVRAFRALGINVPYVRDGPHWVLAEGLEMLRPHGYTIKPIARICTLSLGRFVVCRGGNTTALRRDTHTMAFGALTEKPGSVFLESIGTQLCKAPRSSRHPAIIVTTFGIDATVVLRAP